MNLLWTFLGWAIYNWGLFVYEKDTKYDAYEKEFPYRTYLQQNWENWVWTALIAVALIVFGIQQFKFNVVPVGELSGLGWDDVYYAGCGPISQVIARWLAKMKKSVMVILLLILSLPASAQMIQDKKTFGNVDYLEFIPRGGQVDAIILYYHGLGEVGAGIDAIKRNEIPKLFINGVEKNCVLICPYLPSGKGWSKNIQSAMLDLMKIYSDIYKTDVRIVTGLSLGGMATISTINLAFQKFGRNDFFTAAAIVCGKQPTTYTDFTPFNGIPIVAYHGTKDTQISIGNIRNFRNKVNESGGNVTLHEYENAGHNIWARAYNEDGTSFWKFIEQFKPDKPEPEPEPVEEMVEVKFIDGRLIGITPSGKKLEICFFPAIDE